MYILNKIKELFGLDTVQIFESFYRLNLQANIHKFPTYEQIVNILNEFNSRDDVELQLIFGEDDVIKVRDNEEDKIEYSKLTQMFELEDEIECKLVINKNIDDNKLSVYNFETFKKEFLKNSMLDILESLNMLMKDREYLTFELDDTSQMFTTNTLFFVGMNDLRGTSESNRLERKCQIEELASFYNIEDYGMIPEDFYCKINLDNPFFDIFEHLKTILSIIYISDNAFIDKKEHILHVKIVGQKQLEYQIDIENLQVSNKVLYKIYNWIYTEGNYIDKIGIAKNIISLHARGMNINEIDERTYASIQSNYNLYQKKNVVQYIELKNKLGEFILEITSSVSDLLLEMSGKMKSNFIAVFSFLFSVILANIVSNSPLDNIFTRDIVLLLDIILSGSIIFSQIVYKEVLYKIKNIEKGYEALKKNYEDILDIQDLQEIFQDDEFIQKRTYQIKRQIKKYRGGWIVLILILIVVLELIGEKTVLSQLLLDVKTYIFLFLTKS